MIQLKDQHKQQLDNADSPICIIKSENYKILVTKKLIAHNKKLIEKLHPYIFSKGEIHEYTESEFKKLSGESEFLDCLGLDLKEIATLIDNYSIQVGVLEDLVFDRTIPNHFVDSWFLFKKNITKIERLLSRKHFTVKEFKSDLEDEHKVSHYLDIVKFEMRNARALISKLDNLYSYYTSIKDEHLNANTYMLTVLSGIFLPLNLIVGFFGMNTQGLFLGEKNNGTWIVTQLLIVIFLLLTFGIPTSRVLAGKLRKFISIRRFKKFLSLNKFIK